MYPAPPVTKILLANIDIFLYKYIIYEKNTSKNCKVIVIGGGVIGSVAYHLAKFGWKDTILLERSVNIRNYLARAGLVVS